jgi:hypothetical protein
MIATRQSVSDERLKAFEGLRQYLSGITRIPMEDYLSEVDKHPVLSEDEEQALAEQVYNGDDGVALEKLVLSNLRLVAKIALECCDGQVDDFEPGNDGIAALYRWSMGAAVPAKALTYRRALPAAAGS